MNTCYFCEKIVNRAPYTREQTICDPCRKKWRVTLQEEQGKMEQKKQDIKNYWIRERKG